MFLLYTQFAHFFVPKPSSPKSQKQRKNSCSTLTDNAQSSSTPKTVKTFNEHLTQVKTNYSLERRWF